MKHPIFTLAFAAALISLSSLPVVAVPITYSYNGEGTGLLEDASIFGTTPDQSFVDAKFIIKAVADTNNIQPWALAEIQNTHLSTTIEIGGLGTFNLETPSHTWRGAAGGLGRDLDVNWITLNEPELAAFSLDKNFGPILENDPSDFNQFVAYIGNATHPRLRLSFSDIDYVYFSATVPEPTTLALFGLGLAGLGAIRRKKLAA